MVWMVLMRGADGFVGMSAGRLGSSGRGVLVGLHASLGRRRRHGPATQGERVGHHAGDEVLQTGGLLVLLLGTLLLIPPETDTDTDTHTLGTGLLTHVAQNG